ncbi:flagellar basal body L-ring protein FlgH [Aurantiacibacter poecillastricola]|uniref:flagellar basal body L-ring protein FlgH n=1 Tax=Aurantiacibacter poecillastricola TaxID=3064385 RepID=UPI00273F4328|nr:flagellar basal body L-ring protein FlgH [Aurantiacibacter sp. 219JJ12-13]MDP5263115.1 flagellar basal body L-ring protein FlgH [Aurantiacibacter sp. 219JJ12-13]
MKRILAAGLFALTLSACAMEGGRPAPGFAATLPPPAPLHAPRNGAIYQAANGYAALHEGTRARRVGDLVTVILVESVSTNKTTSATTARNGSASITPPSAGPLDFLNPDALNAASQSSFKGSGTASQRSQLNGAIAVTIAEVRSNGTALVTGERHMRLSQGEEWVQFAGILRLADIDIDNRILSTRIADAQIIYGGQGAIQQASRPGWLGRFFNMVSPF